MAPHPLIVARCALVLVLATGALGRANAVVAERDGDGLAEQLADAAPSADRAVIALATRALACVKSEDPAATTQTLSIIDYSRPSTEPRLWVFDLARKQLLFEEWVAHGRNSGENMATAFSDVPGSLMSSIGAFRTADTYTGHNGYSLRLKGLEPGFNDRAWDRAIVMHGAPYVSSQLIRNQGRLGRSFGCPAVRTEVAHRLIDTIRDGTLLFAYYPDRQWLQSSRLLGDCGSQGTPGVSSAARAPLQ
jgi:hypothetical protein